MTKNFAKIKKSKHEPFTILHLFVVSYVVF